MTAPEHLTPGESVVVQPLANCRNFAVDSVMEGLSFQQLTIGVPIALTPDVVSTRGADAEDHEEGKRRSGL